ncbi:malignant T cell amplified sequence 1 isoform 2 [Capsaspora owczarzaki ATCC 30864]|uniref:malignant T cell amplified sequence 1 isoform 2 n=1 Tax=Capsaspora owczarzaki (strain ATCC 30864) TaxID=595528 RepID=UPI0001FE4F1A|nr:malignant T cell amplified sequence 1 isoform 2 [Capsaspora owczarzaki ATCC 30864]|eukprot:XP_004347907.1 malignant T cell amplified sequence 1 isoform 2 [Capsaspora owczarzaki ATCC 30864]
MFKRFNYKEEVANAQQVKSSVHRAIRQKAVEQFPGLEPYLDEVMPKKDPIHLLKLRDSHLQLIVVNKEVLFFHDRDGPYMPTLRLVHKCPSMITHQTVDIGAFPFVMRGVNVMAPGLTSKGGKLTPAPVNTVVAVMGEGKEHAMAIGIMKMSSDQIKSVNKGIAIESVHFLNDGLWAYKNVDV